MKICLVYPPIDDKIPAKSTLLGLGYLGAVLRNAGHWVEIKDLIFGGVVDYSRYDVICVSAMFTSNKKSLYSFLTTIKERYPLIHLIVGGSHASTFPDEVFEYCDTVICGEGEEVICDIVKNRTKGIIIAERIINLDKLPFPAWDLMWDDIQEINRRNWNTPFHIRRPFIHMITSRGCPNACTFCAVKVVWGRRWIPRSSCNVVSEIKELYNMGFREIHFNDDNCSIDKKRLCEICDLILINGLNIKIACPTGIHIGTLDKPLLKLMKRAGFYRLCFGIETGSQRMQKIIKKNIDLQKAKQVIHDANDLGYWTSATFIFDFPEETEDDVQSTLQFVKDSGLDFPIFYNLNIQPKTELYEKFGSNV